MRGGLFLYLAICLFSTTALRAADSGVPKVGVSEVKSLLVNHPNLEDNDIALNKLQFVLGSLHKKQDQYKKEADFVEHLYYYTHRKLLKKYNQYASLAETLTRGDYDCLTATAIYSILLTELSLPHAIVETNYHIYILVYPDTENEILLETTNPAYGFITNPGEIEQLKAEYKSANNEQQKGQADFEINIERRLQGQELIGLLFYNQSVNEVNQGNWHLAKELANQAFEYYPNVRITQLIAFIDLSGKSASL